MDESVVETSHSVPHEIGAETLTVHEVEIVQQEVDPHECQAQTDGVVASSDPSMAVIQAVPSSDSGILLPISEISTASHIIHPSYDQHVVQPVTQPMGHPTVQSMVPTSTDQPGMINSTLSCHIMPEQPTQAATLQSYNFMQLGTAGLTDSLMSDRATREDLACVCRWIGCYSYFSDRQSLIQHVNAVHVRVDKDVVDYKCNWVGCPRRGKGFNARYKMLIHIRTHTNEKPHICGICQKCFSRLENLKIHKRSHTGEKPYLCPVEGCRKAYSNSSDRFKHVRTHQEERPYMCKMPGCNKRYTDPSSLRKHVRIQGHNVRYTQDMPDPQTITVPKQEKDANSNQLTQNIDSESIHKPSESSLEGQKKTRLEELPLDLSRTVAGANVGSGDNYVLKITYVS